ncbi:MAG: indole-3-glycerol phosphate synthase TrpC [Cytophagales bacterium]|nr:indole-3-glycerol phosphate synthase TrpC [Cytophagales bacterium]
MTILDKIVANTEKEVAERKAQVATSTLENSAYFERETYSLKDYLVLPEKSGIIAEVKKQSPSKGIINDKVTVEEVGQGYFEAGASAISVLTDLEFFGGKMEYLTSVREVVEIPVLRKDFIVDEYQLLEAKAIGADVILLIAACLEPKRLEELAKFAKSLGLEVLMEVHNKEELDRSLNPYLDVVGVNNRNLKTFDVSIQTSLDLAEFIPNEFRKISESGLKDAETIVDLKKGGFEGFLIGETFMKTENPAQALQQLISEIKTLEK